MSSQTQQTTAPAPRQPGTHHFVITLQRPTGGGFHTATWAGSTTPPAGATRTDVYRGILAEIAQHNPEFARPNVMFFALEPDEL